MRAYADADRSTFVDMVPRPERRNAAFAYLALSGGGGDGAYGAGVLNGWSESGTRPEFTLVSGVSTGALIAPFADSYFEGVEAMWDSRSHEMAETAATLGYPTAQVTREIADRATALSERLAGTRAGLSRVLAEGRDETVRALAAREHATAHVHQVHAGA